MRRLVTRGGMWVAAAAPVAAVIGLMQVVLPSPVRVRGWGERAVAHARALVPGDKETGRDKGPALERRSVRRGKRVAARAVKTSASVVEWGNLTVVAQAGGGRTIRLAVHPASSAAPGTRRRAIVLVEGTADGAGDDARAGDRTAAWLTGQGFHVFTVMGEPGARGAATDVPCAVAWIKGPAAARLAAHGIAVDPARVALVGRAAGAERVLAAAFAGAPAECAAEDARIDAAIALHDGSARVSAPLGRGRGEPPPVLLVHPRQDRFGWPVSGPALQARLVPPGTAVRTVEIAAARPQHPPALGAPDSRQTELAITRFLSDLDAKAL